MPIYDIFTSFYVAPPLTFTQSSRIELLQSTIQDLKNVGSKAKLTSGGKVKFMTFCIVHCLNPIVDAALALLSIKTLGKDPAGSRYISSSTNLSALLGFAITFKDKDEPEATSEALRSIANALLLVEDARSTFLSKEVNGGETCILLLEVSAQKYDNIVHH